MNKCKFYSVDNIKFPSANLTKTDIKKWLEKNNFTNIVIKVMPEWYSNKAEGKISKKQRNYEGLILFSAKLS